MASLVNGTSGTSTSDNASSAASMPGSVKPSAKPAVNASSKNNDLNRKQASSPSNGVQRASAPPNAWKAGMNPITQRSTILSQQNGANQQSKPGPRSTTQGTDSSERIGNDRLIHLLGSSMGYTASITTKSGETFSGIFFGAAVENEPTYLLKMVQQTRHTEKMEDANGVKERSQDYVGIGKDYSMSFDSRDVTDLVFEGVPITTQEKQQNGSTTGFRTDTDISGNMAIRERELKRWTPSDDAHVDMSLEGSNGGTWDQFAANEEKFGLKTDYNEEFYTTSLDRNSAQYRQNEARAARLAREIEGTGSKHTRARDEEEGDEDEEEKYSGVRRQATDYPPLQSTNPNRYMPPARRPLSGQTAVAGTSVDPAIISSQLARPEASPQRAAGPKVDTMADDSTPSRGGEAPSNHTGLEPTKDSAPAKPAAITKAPVPNATANVEIEVLNQFRKFGEKQKTKVADDRQKRARQDKDIKLNDLKGFSKNFKLNTPVPKDLVPILAKDKKKQDEIMEKARREAEQQAVSPTKGSTGAEDSTSLPVGEIKRDPSKGMATDFNQVRQQFPPRGPNNRQHAGQFGNPTSPQATGSPGYLSHRLAENQRALKAGIPMAVPTPLPIYPQKPPSRPTVNAGVVANSQASSTVRTPTSAASKNFNVNAMEFKPNPAASTFQPTGPPNTSASPRNNASSRAPPRTSSPSAFFGAKKAVSPSERPSILNQSDPLQRLQEKAETDNKVKDFASNGGIAPAYTTPVTWSVLKDDEAGKSYKDMFNEPPATSTGVSPQPSRSSPMNPNQAHLHQLPAHLQQPGMHGAPGPHHAPYPVPSQPHLYPGAVPGPPHQYDDHRMHGSPSASSYNTPRMPNAFVPYASPMGPGVQYPYGQPMPSHMMGPNGPPPPNFRQYPSGPQYMPSPGQQMAAPMMVQQGSQGSYMAPQGMAVPHMHMYGPGPNPSYNGPTQPPSGYPSPRGAPMMMHQGSYPGQPSQGPPGGGQYGQPQPYYMPSQPPHMNPMRGGYPSSPQPHYSQSPQPQYHYPPQQPQRIHSQGYASHPQGPPHHAPTPQGPPPGAPMEGGEAMR